MATIGLPPDFKEFLKLLKAHDARFLVIGGYAVNAFGYVRNTLDIDIWIASEAENRSRVIAAIREFGFPSTADDVLDAPDAMLRMGVPPLRIEVIQKIAAVKFEDCWPRRVILDDDGLSMLDVSEPA